MPGIGLFAAPHDREHALRLGRGLGALRVLDGIGARAVVVEQAHEAADVDGLAELEANVDSLIVVLNEKLHVKKVKFLAVRETENETSDHPEEQFDIDFALMSGEFAELLKAFSVAINAAR